MAAVKHVDSLSLVHYRTDDATYFDCALHESDLPQLGWEAFYVWFRLLSGPEYGRHGFPVSRLTEALGKPQEIDYERAVESLLRAGVIHRDGDYYVYPNVEWETPPDEPDRDR